MIRSAAFALVLLATAASAQTPRLVFRAAVDPTYDPVVFDTTSFDPASFDDTAVPDAPEVSGDVGTLVPVILTPSAPEDTLAMERAALPDGSTVFLGQALQTLGSGSVTDAHLSFDAYTNAPEISLTMTPAAGQAFARLTEARVSRAIAVVLDGRVLTAPTVNGPVPNGRVQITGQFTVAEATAIVAAIREATQSAAARAAMLRDLRARVDLSRPDSAVMAFRRAGAAGDWLTYVRILHPDTQRLFREKVEEGRLILERDSVVAFDTRLDPTEPPFRPAPVRMAVRDILETDAPGASWSDFSDEQIATLFHAAASGRLPSVTPAKVGGTVDAGGGTAYVVLIPAAPTGFGDPGISETSVFEARRSGEQWRVLLPSGGW